MSHHNSCSITKVALLLDLTSMRKGESKAAEAYKRSAHHVTDERDKEILLGIARDEERHADIVKRLIDLVEESYDENRNGGHESTPNIG